jgi:hypothetical protein
MLVPIVAGFRPGNGGTSPGERTGGRDCTLGLHLRLPWPRRPLLHLFDVDDQNLIHLAGVGDVGEGRLEATSSSLVDFSPGLVLLSSGVETS